MCRAQQTRAHSLFLYGPGTTNYFYTFIKGYFKKITRHSTETTCSMQSQKYLISSPLQKKFADPLYIAFPR